MRIATVLSLVFIVWVSVAADPAIAGDNGKAKDKRCAEVREKISALRSRMRKPYRPSQGVKFDERMLKLKKLRRKYCR